MRTCMQNVERKTDVIEEIKPHRNDDFIRHDERVVIVLRLRLDAAVGSKRERGSMSKDIR